MPNIAGTAHLPHDKTKFGDRLAVPNQVTPIDWYLLPMGSTWSAASWEADFIAVGKRDVSLSESIRNVISNFDIPGLDPDRGETNFKKMGYFDLQGWVISYDQPLTSELNQATAVQLVDDYIKKVPVPYVSPGQTITPDQQLQTMRETLGEDANHGEEGIDNVKDTSGSNNGVATSVPSVINPVQYYEMGPHMFFEQRMYLGTRRGNAIPTGENEQVYAGNVQTDIGGIAAGGRYTAILWTVSMPHLFAYGTPNTEADEPLSIFDDWEELNLGHQRAPLEFFEMQDEISLQNARYRFRQDMFQEGGGGEALNSEPQVGLWGITDTLGKYVQDKRQYFVKQGMWEQKPLMFSIRSNYTINAPFTLVPNRM